MENTNKTGRTLWDFLHENRLITFISFFAVIVLLAWFSYNRTAFNAGIFNFLPSDQKPKWEGSWGMKISNAQTETILRQEGEQIVGAYAILDYATGNILTAQMSGKIVGNIYAGSWYMFSDSTFQNHGGFQLEMKDENEFEGTYFLSGSRSKKYKWTGKRI